MGHFIQVPVLHVFVLYFLTSYVFIVSLFFLCLISAEDVDASTGEAGGNACSQWIILGLSLLVTTVVGYVNFMNPAQRWQQLRGLFEFLFVHSII